MTEKHMQIGEVATRTELSLRTIRYYEEVGLVSPSARTTGGFRLYSESDVQRLELVKRMKPLDFSLEDMGALLHVVDELDAGADTEEGGGSPQSGRGCHPRGPCGKEASPPQQPAGARGGQDPGSEGAEGWIDPAGES